MKKINNKLAMALLRGAVALSGIMATMIIVLFTENLKSCMLTLLIGVSTVVLVDEIILSHGETIPND